MLSLLCPSVRRSRGAARLSVALLVICSLPVPPAVVSVHGQSCQQGGSPLCTPCHASYNIIWDPAFQQTSCTKWQFDPGTERVLTGYYCGSGNWSAPYARFNGPYNGWRWIHQNADALPQAGRDHFELTYTYQITDPLFDPNTALHVWLLKPDGNWLFVDGVSNTNGSPYWCHSRQIDLGRHPEWVGQQLQVVFSAQLPGESNIILGTTALWQSW